MASSKKKLQCYLSDRAWEAIEARRGSGSETLGEIIESFILGGIQGISTVDTPSSLVEKINALERRVEALESQESIQGVSSPTIPVTTPLPPPVSKIDTPVDTLEALGISKVDTPVDTSQGISQAELCDRHGIKSKNLTRFAQGRGYEGTKDFLEEKTGWQRRGRKWFPKVEGSDDPAS